MRILATNDDGVHAPGIWHAVRALASMDDVEVIVCAPDREQSGVGTAVTLHHPIKVSEVTPYVDGVKTYAVEGTPSDAVIVALESLITDEVDLVVSGINQGANLGRDMLISGTVGAAQQAYSRDINAIAISVAALIDVPYEPSAFVLRSIVQHLIDAEDGKGSWWHAALTAHGPWLMNVNLPKKNLDQLEGVQITKVGKALYLDQVEESDDVRSRYFWITRSRPSEVEPEETTDIAAIRKNRVSVNLLEASERSHSTEIASYNLANDVQQMIDSEVISVASGGALLSQNDGWDNSSVTPPWLNERTRAIRTLRGSNARIMCRDLARTGEFYRKLGFAESEQSKKSGRNENAVVLERDGFSLECRVLRHWRSLETEVNGAKSLEAARIVFRVMALEALYDTFKKEGLEVSSSIEKNYRDNTMEFEVEDPDGNKIVFVQGTFPVRHAKKTYSVSENSVLLKLLPDANQRFNGTASLAKAVTALDRAEIDYVGQLLDMSPHEILQVPGIGPEGYRELLVFLFGIDPVDTPPITGLSPLRQYLQPWKEG
mgnify:CR=1 FL=1